MLSPQIWLYYPPSATTMFRVVVVCITFDVSSSTTRPMSDTPPLNQAALFTTSDSDVDEEYYHDKRVQETKKSDDSSSSSASSMSEGSTEDTVRKMSPFESWFKNDRNVPPQQRIPYLMMMMATIDPAFSLDEPPFNQQKKKLLKPQLSMYRKEVCRPDGKVKVSNKKIDELLDLMKTSLPLHDPSDIDFVKTSIEAYKNKLIAAAKEKAAAEKPPSRVVSRKTDRMQFVECMAHCTIKPLYMRVNEVLTRYEMDGRNSDNVAPDFYDAVVLLFNDSTFTPTSLSYCDLHEDFVKSYDLPKNKDYDMTIDRAKALITSMKPRIAKIKSNYEQSGNGDGMRHSGGNDDDEPEGEYNLKNCMEGDNRRSFLLAGDTSNLLYWWEVLDEEGMLDYTLSVLPIDVGGNSETVPSAITTSSSAKRTKDDQKIINDLKQELGGLSSSVRESNSIQLKQMEHDKANFDKRINLEERVYVLQQDRMAFD